MCYHTLDSCNDSFHWGVTQLSLSHPICAPYYYQCESIHLHKNQGLAGQLG